MPATVDLATGQVIVQSQDQILAELNGDFTSAEGFGPNWLVGDTSFTGRQNKILANREAFTQSAIAAANNALDLDNATGQQLDLAGSLMSNRTGRKGPTRSTVPATLTGTPGLDVGDRRVQYSVTNDLWRTPVGATIEANGTVAVTLTAEATGPVFAPAAASTVWVIVDVTTGWTFVESTGDASRGRDRELDPPYRARLIEAKSSGTATVPAMKEALARVTDAFTYDNNNTPNTRNGVPAWHSHTIAEGGDDQTIAETIYNNEGGGTGYFGDITYTVTDPSDGAQVPVKFSRIINIQVIAELAYKLSGDTTLPAGAAETVAAAAVLRVNSNGAGIDVDPGDLIAAGALALPPGTVQPDDSTGQVAGKGDPWQLTPVTISTRQNAFSVNSNQAAQVTGTEVAPFNLIAADHLDIAIGDGPLTVITVLAADFPVISAATIEQVVSAFAQQAPAGVIVGSSGGALVFTTVDTGTGARITVDGGSSATLLTALGIFSGATTGTGPDITVTFFA